jgi:hypothetical protein
MSAAKNKIALRLLFIQEIHPRKLSLFFRTYLLTSHRHLLKHMIIPAFDVNAAGDTIVVLGGQSPSAGSLGTAEMLNSTSQTWTSLPNMTTRRTWSPSSSVVNKTKILACGGSHMNDGLGGDLNSCEMLDLANLTLGWSSLIANMSIPRCWTSGTLLPDGKTFLMIAGASSGVSVSSCEKLDVASNTWSSAASLTLGVRQAHCSVLYKNIVIVIGGSNGTKALNSCEQYSVDSDTWSSFPSLSIARSQFGAAVVLGKIYVVGGYTLQGGESLPIGLNSVEVFDGASWLLLSSSLTQPRIACAAVVYQNKLVVLGGNSSAVEVYDPVTSAWNTTFLTMPIEPFRFHLIALSIYEGSTPVRDQDKSISMKVIATNSIGAVAAITIVLVVAGVYSYRRRLFKRSKSMTTSVNPAYNPSTLMMSKDSRQKSGAEADLQDPDDDGYYSELFDKNPSRSISNFPVVDGKQILVFDTLGSSIYGSVYKAKFQVSKRNSLSHH